MPDQSGERRVHPSANWCFAESEEDGEAWLNNPVVLQGYVDYELRNEEGRSGRRRIMMATKAWLESQIHGVRKEETGPLWAALPSMVVLPDATGEKLRATVGTVIRQGGLDVYSTILPPPLGGKR